MTELHDPHIEEAVETAQALRAELGLVLDSPFDLDLLDIAERRLGLPVCILHMPKSVAGAYLRKGRGSLVFIQSENYPTRQRFTVAHEVGHHCLGHGSVFDSYKDVGRDSSDPREQQANYFASELMMPLVAVQEWLDRELEGASPTLIDVVKLAECFHMSPPAALYRLSKGKFPGLDRAQLTRLWDQVWANEHVAIAEQLGIGHGEDRLSQVYDEGLVPRLPAAVPLEQAEHVLRLVRSTFPGAASDGTTATRP